MERSGAGAERQQGLGATDEDARPKLTVLLAQLPSASERVSGAIVVWADRLAQAARSQRLAEGDFRDPPVSPGRASPRDEPGAEPAPQVREPRRRAERRRDTDGYDKHANVLRLLRLPQNPAPHHVVDLIAHDAHIAKHVV